MINKETIISSFDDKSTLLKWLKKVEAALKNASAVSFNVNKRGDATLTFSIVFDDGSTIESNPIVLQQGESVESAAIVNGHLILTLTNGDELDAGVLFSGNVNISGNLSVTGTISGKTPILTADEEQIIAMKPVIEVMNGYSFTPPSTQGLSIRYASIVKNGNLLSCCIFGRLTTDDPLNYEYKLGTFTIPSSVANKIIADPANNFVLYKGQSLIIGNVLGSVANTPLVVSKPLNTQILDFSIFEAGLSVNTTYLFRIEQTFLLSENLAA